MLNPGGFFILSAYWYPFRQPDDSLLPGTTLAAIWQRYTFDRQLRLVMMDAVVRPLFPCRRLL